MKNMEICLCLYIVPYLLFYVFDYRIYKVFCYMFECQRNGPYIVYKTPGGLTMRVQVVSQHNETEWKQSDKLTVWLIEI